MHRLREVSRRFGLPLLVFVLVRAFLIFAARKARSNGFSAGAWSHWDSAHYLSIAEKGYEFYSCARVPGYDPADFCGNTGWLPGFPLLIRLLTKLHLDPVFSGSLIAAMFALATLILIWNLYLGAELSVRSILALCLAAFFPGHVYEHALFPVSMFAFFQAASLYAWATRRYAWAGALGGVAAFSYGSGLFLAGVLGLDLLLGIRNHRPAQFLQRVALGPGLVVAGFAVAAWVQWLDVGIWHGYFAVQGKYHYEPTPPWQSLEPHIEAVLSGHLTAPHVQSVFVIGLVAVLVWAAAKLPRLPTDRVLAIFVLAYWIIPLSLGGNLSLYRAEAVLLPGAALANKLRPSVIVALLVPAIVIAFRMAMLFFRNVLV